MLVRPAVAVLPLFMLSTAGSVVAAPAEAPPAGAERRRSEMVWVDPIKDLAPDAVAAAAADGHIAKLLFVNRCAGGCTISPGDNDSRANTSSILGGTRTLSEFAGTAETFDAVVSCLRDVYGPYDVEIVTTDPGPEAFHHEAILAGTPTEAGLDPSIGGIASAACQPLNNVISFSFANLDPDDVEEMCWTVAQESAHSFGLPNHVFDCSDPMTYLGPSSGFDCGRKYFRNKFLTCGEFEPGPCNCIDKQNSHAELTAVFGVGTPPAATEIMIASPAADATVTDGFTVFFFATNTRLVDRVELWINGTKYATQPGHSSDKRNDDYNFATPALADGYLDIEIKAFDDIGTEGSSTVTALKGAPCENADSCFEFQECSDGRCLYPEPAGVLGDECAYEQYCVEGTCLEHDGRKLCATACNPQVSGSCPMGFECVGAGGCFPVDEGGGCCAVAGARDRDGFPLVALGLSLLAIVVLRRRRAAR